MTEKKDPRMGCIVLLLYFALGCLVGWVFVRPWVIAQIHQVQAEQKRRTDAAERCWKQGGRIDQIKNFGTVCKLPDGTVRWRF